MPTEPPPAWCTASTPAVRPSVSEPMTPGSCHPERLRIVGRRVGLKALTWAIWFQAQRKKPS